MTTDLQPLTYTLAPLSPADGDRLRAAGGIVNVADSHPGYPCRQCLRDAEAGDELLLVSHDPFTTDSPYRSASPIFIHAAPCAAYPADGELPAQLTTRQLSVRGFDADAMMLDAAVIDGHELHATVVRLFDNEAIERLHVHNLSRGCWATTIERA